MPDLDQNIIDDVTKRLKSFLKKKGGYGEPEYLDAGGSAAVFKVPKAEKIRVFKVTDPKFLEGTSGEAEKRRLDIQRELINNNCPSLIQTYLVEEAEGTSFIEMEFVDWPQLKKVLSNIPDEAIASLIFQLVEAVKYLEEKNIVHRDIKPENIHVSPDFKELKLLDLGVAREFEVDDPNDDAAISDHGKQRPFLATAQYSSPEYLFRLDEPTKELWDGLNIYQVGAVLHDLIEKKPIFQKEMDMGNRWLVAKAVLSTPPSFTETPSNYLTHFKALASRCLVKNLDTRLKIVDWDDFKEKSSDPLLFLKHKLKQGSSNTEVSNELAKLDFKRRRFVSNVKEIIQTKLIETCGNLLPSTINESSSNNINVNFQYTDDKLCSIRCSIKFDWQDGVYEHCSNISLSAYIAHDSNKKAPPKKFYIICTGTIDHEMDNLSSNIVEKIAESAGSALDLLEATPDNLNLHAYDLLKA